MRTIAQVLTRHGFGHLVETIDLGRFVPLWMRSRAKVKPEEHEVHTLGDRLMLVCTELGPTFVKLGQMLSTRPDLLPPEIIKGLQTLQDQVEPFAPEQAVKIVEKDLGVKISEAFESFENRPFASGSIAQAHRAVAKSGQKVVVKVRRPDIENVIRTDMNILSALAEAAERYVAELKPFDPVMIVEEFRRSIDRELDFINEASSTARFGESLAGEDYVKVPEVRWDLTGSEVLTFEWISGVSLHEVLEGWAKDIDRKQLAHNIARLFLKQYFETGLFHADPHPGNMLISAPARIGLIDFGLVGRVSDEMMTQLMIALVATVNQEVDWVVDAFTELGEIGPDTEMSRLKSDMQLLLDKYHGLPLKRLDLVTIFREVSDVLRRNDVTLPRDFVLMAKSLAMTAGIVLQLDPELNLVELLQPRMKSLLLRRFSVQKLAKTSALSLWHIVNILKNAPGQLRTAIRQFTKGQWQVKIMHQNLDRLGRELDRSSNRVAFALIISSTIIGSSMMLASQAQAQIFGIELRWFGVAGYFAAGLMGLWLVWAIFRSGRLY